MSWSLAKSWPQCTAAAYTELIKFGRNPQILAFFPNLIIERVRKKGPDLKGPFQEMREFAANPRCRENRPMTCQCARLPDLFKLASRPQVEDTTSVVATGNWVQLHQCRECDQLWRIDGWDKGRTQFVVRINAADGWEEFDASDLHKAFLVESRGGLGEAPCQWAGCGRPQVKGVRYCVDHLFATGARE